MTHLWEQFKDSPTWIKVAITVVLTIWLVAFITMLTALFFLWERPAGAQLPTPGLIAGAPTISLEPVAGPVNTPLTVRGQGWTPGSTVLIYLTGPYETETGNFALNSAIVDAAGQFTVTVPVVAEPGWQIPGLVRVIARTAAGEAGTQAFFSLIALPDQPTQTITTTPAEPTSTPTLPVLTPAVTPQPGAPGVTAIADLNIRSGPGVGYPAIGLLRANQSAEVTGVSADGRWWQINFPGVASGRGWVAAQYTMAQNTTNVPVVRAEPLPPTATPQPLPTATPQPTPVVVTDWRGEYYNNIAMSGNPVLVRNDPAINFDWARGAPAAGLSPDNFSARWSRSLYFPAGAYRFTIRADDGVLFWVDDRLIIDQWHDSSARIYAADANLSEGFHNLKMAYYERTGDAIAQLKWDRLSTYPDWKGEYFSNPNLSGAPTFVRNDPEINFNWGSGGAAAGLPVDNFSVRWTRDVYFPAGTYRLTLKVDDGARLWVDGNLVIDQWRDNSLATYVVEVNLPEGSRSIKLEYYEHWYEAGVQLRWARVESYPDWKAEYFDNRSLRGEPVLVRNETKIDHDWDSSSPGNGVPTDNFSARWTRQLDFQEGTYRFEVEVDDGVRLWVDDNLLIDSWQDGSTRELEASRKLGRGKHQLEIEYYERTGGAQIEVSWRKQDQPDNKPPEAVTGGPYTVKENNLLSVDGRGSSDPDGSIKKYEWDFNYDGRTFNVDATGSSVSTRYPDGPSTIVIALRVTDDDGASRTATTQVTVRNTPPVVEAGGPYAGQVNQSITLAGTALDAGLIDQTGLLYSWNFGDGSLANGPIVSHSYAQAGTYTITLTVADKDGGQGSDTSTIQITKTNQPQPPQAVITGPTSGLVDKLLKFSGSNSTDSDGSIVSYAWNFGDGETDSGAEVTHTYAASGTYSLKLTVTDNSGLTATTSQLVQIEEPPQTNEPPQAVITGPTSGLVDEPLRFNGNKSTDSDGEIVSYSWDFGDGETDTGAKVTHTYAASGTYNLKLTVTDNDDLTATASQLVQIEAPPPNQPPQAVITGPTSGLVDEPLRFNGNKSTDSDGEIVSYSWDFGDGETDTGAKVTHRYAAPGTYNLKLTVTDNDDLTATASQLVQVEEPPQTNEPPQAAITGPTSGLTDEPLDFSGSNSSDSDGNIVSYIWDFGDGETAAGADVTHTYAASGTYGLQLTVTDDDGSADTASQTIRVEDPVNYPPTAVITGPVSGVVGEPLTFSGSASNDSDGNIVSYSWDFGDGVLGTGVVVSHTYTITGSYVITLTVTDDDDLINSAGYPVQINPAGQAPP